MLDRDTRVAMEARFSRDFSRVRIHADGSAERAAAALGARAFTTGNHIAFGAGGYAPHSDAGRRLLAHELTHVVQQTDTGVHAVQLAPDPNREANQVERELEMLVNDGTWKEIRKRIYPKESAAGIARAKERKAGTRPDLTGLGSIKSVERFAADIHVIQKKWGGLKAPDRVKEIGAAGSTALEKVDVPGFLDVVPIQTDFKGSFSPGAWTFNVSETLVNSPDLNDTDAAEVANVTLHESRHAEQHFVAARHAAGVLKQDADTIHATGGIPKVIAEKAVAKKFDDKTDPAVAEHGKQMFQAAVTEGAKNQKISDEDQIKELAALRLEAIKALQNLRLDRSSKSALDEAKAKCAEMKKEIALVEKLYGDYRRIPYEADAHEAGDTAELAFRGWPK
jgi:hypothetical protein